MMLDVSASSTTASNGIGPSVIPADISTYHWFDEVDISTRN